MKKARLTFITRYFDGLFSFSFVDKNEDTSDIVKKVDYGEKVIY